MIMTSSRTGVIVSKVKFTLEPPAGANLVRSYSDTELRIGEQRVQRSCLVTADRLITDWPPATFDELAPAHLEAIFALAPELVLLGTGPTQRFAAPSVRGTPPMHTKSASAGSRERTASLPEEMIRDRKSVV